SAPCVRAAPGWASRVGVSAKLAQEGEGRPVRLGLRFFRRLEGHGHTQEATVGHEPAEGGHAQLALADLFVAIEPGAEGRLGVVEMEGADAPDPHVAGTALHGGVVAFGLSEIVAGGEEVAGVEADPDALRNLDGAEEQGELLEGPADGRAAARGVLERSEERRVGKEWRGRRWRARGKGRRTQ